MRLITYLKSYSWKVLLRDEFEEEYFKDLEKKVTLEYKNNLIYPNKKYIFDAFNLCSFNNLKVVMLGLDPYSNKSANGLAFSSYDNTIIPNSLKNIFNELYSDLGISNNISNLENWSTEGVLLLNNVLTIGDNRSHKHNTWKLFTDRVIEIINNKKQNVVFLLLGKDTHIKADLINKKNNLVIKLNHPSSNSTTKTGNPLIGSKCFSKTNKYLEKYNIKKINWKL